MRRVVFDTTILISAFITRGGGLSHELLSLARDGKFQLVLSSAIILETWRKLLSGHHIRARYRYSDERAHRFCRGLLRIADVLRSPQPIPGIVRDPGDEMILACAVAGQADVIVSRDKDLLSLDTFRGLPIITPEVFRQQLRDAEQSD
jgi:putative PIN family toxin of toxin-antitoxin system